MNLRQKTQKRVLGKSGGASEEMEPKHHEQESEMWWIYFTTELWLELQQKEKDQKLVSSKSKASNTLQKVKNTL